MPNFAGLIFNSVTQFVEQVGRRQQWRYADLDVMVCLYNGPTALALGFKPAGGSRHPNYPLMFVTDAQIINQAAIISEVEVTYQGRIDGRSPTEPQLSIQPFQGSRDFTTGWMVQTSAPVYQTVTGASGISPQNTAQTIPAFYSAGTQQWTIRWWGENASVRFHAYPLPGDEQFGGLGKGNCKWEIIGWFAGPQIVSVSNVDQASAQAVYNQYPHQPVIQMERMYIGRTVVQRGKWYEITEQYGYVPIGVGG